MKKSYLLSLVALGIFFSSCEDTPTILESINEQGIKVNIKSSNGKYLSSNWDEYIYADKDVASDWERFKVFKVKDDNYVIQAYTGKYVSADLGSDQEIESNRENYSTWETFSLVEINDSTLAIKAENQKFITVKPEDNRLYAVADSIGTKEQFVFIINN